MYKAVYNSETSRSNLLNAAALCGREDILEYLVGFNKNATLAVVKEAAEYGLLNLLQRNTTELRLKNKKNPFTQVSLKKVAGNGHVDCLRYLLEQGCVPDRSISLAVAENGYLDCLQVAHEHKCGWDSKTHHRRHGYCSPARSFGMSEGPARPGLSLGQRHLHQRSEVWPPRLFAVCARARLPP